MTERSGRPIGQQRMHVGGSGELAERTSPRRVDSPSLFRGDREVVIVHLGQEYRLRITRAEKLILTK